MNRLNLIHLYYVEEMPIEDIAVHFGVSTETIRNRRSTFDLPSREREWDETDRELAADIIGKRCFGASLQGDMRTLASELRHKTSTVMRNVGSMWLERFAPNIDVSPPIPMRKMKDTITSLPMVKLNHQATLPTRGSEYSAGLDLYSVEECEIPAGTQSAVKTGVGGSIPDGWAGLICPRSGLALKHGITIQNAPGVIDSDYRGEWIVTLYNTGTIHHNTYKVNEGDRIGQVVIVPCLMTTPELVDDLDETDRGKGGFGSTGK